jgi:hypothetical protein
VPHTHSVNEQASVDVVERIYNGVQRVPKWLVEGRGGGADAGFVGSHAEGGVELDAPGGGGGWRGASGQNWGRWRGRGVSE